MEKFYFIKKCSQNISIDADWEKPFWQDVEAALLNVSHWNPASSDSLPSAQVKLKYDNYHLYVIFHVQDRFVIAITTQTNGPVYRDSCVEFFFSPDRNKPDAYFNLETNCCGVLLAQYHTGPRPNSRFLDVVDCQSIRIASTTSGPIQHEITGPLIWTLEYAIPLEMLTRYADIEKPTPGVIWRGNFYKCADDCSYPHWISWSPVSGKTPDFHRPDCLGLLQFI